MQRQGEQHDEHDCIAGHLQAELDDRLRGDPDEPGDCPGPQPPRHRVVVGRSQTASDGLDDDAGGDDRRDDHEQSAFCEQLQVVVVRLRVDRGCDPPSGRRAWRVRRCRDPSQTPGSHGRCARVLPRAPASGDRTRGAAKARERRGQSGPEHRPAAESQHAARHHAARAARFGSRPHQDADDPEREDEAHHARARARQHDSHAHDEQAGCDEREPARVPRRPPSAACRPNPGGSAVAPSRPSPPGNSAPPAAPSPSTRRSGSC